MCETWDLKRARKRTIHTRRRFSRYSIRCQRKNEEDYDNYSAVVIYCHAPYGYHVWFISLKMIIIKKDCGKIQSLYRSNTRIRGRRWFDGERQFEFIFASISTCSYIPFAFKQILLCIPRQLNCNLMAEVF